MEPEGERPLAVFDLDGTLIRGDSLLPFMVRYGWRHRRGALPGIAVDLGLYACRFISDRSAKQRVILRFLRGEPLTKVQAEAIRFCERWVARRQHPEGLARLREHQRAGHRVILLSASPSVYVVEVARSLGIEEVVCTRVGSGGEVCTGLIQGENCKGRAKLRLLQDHLGRADAPAASYAYGDSRHDLPVLRWARNGFLLRGGKFVPVTPGPPATVPS